jgi:hypothetical protein
MIFVCVEPSQSSYPIMRSAKDAITQIKGALTVHGNCLPNVQLGREGRDAVSFCCRFCLTLSVHSHRFFDRAAICGVIYADCVKEDQEKVQTGATFVNITLRDPTLIKLSHT